MTTAAQLIRDSYLLANIIDPLEEVEGYYAEAGLTALNDIINQWSSLATYLQTYSIEEINLIAGTYQYSVTPVITQILEANLIDSNNVQTPLSEINLKRQNLINYDLGVTAPTRPTVIFNENKITDTTISTSSIVYFFPVPDQNYTARLYVKKKLGELTQSQIITEISTAYYMPLKYQLTLSLSIVFSSVLPPGFEKEYERLMNELKAANRKDMSVINSNPFGFYGRRFRPWSAGYAD